MAFRLTLSSGQVVGYNQEGVKFNIRDNGVLEIRIPDEEGGGAQVQHLSPSHWAEVAEHRGPQKPRTVQVLR